jgi:phospholipase C
LFRVICPGRHWDPTPSGKNLPIDHVICVVQEKRSFDHYSQDFTPAAGTTVVVAPPSYAVLDPGNKRSSIRPFELLHPCPDDPAHDYESVLLSWRGGKMDGFALASGKEAISYFTTEVLEYYHALARAFSLSARHLPTFSAPLGPTASTCCRVPPLVMSTTRRRQQVISRPWPSASKELYTP